MAVMPPLPASPTLRDLQAWTHAMTEANGWTPTDFRHEACRLVEEVGELINAHRKASGYSHLTDEQRKGRDTVAEEMADILIFLLNLANLERIDVMDAFAAKIAKNAVREWTAAPLDENQGV